jgi:hypothetical protein
VLPSLKPSETVTETDHSEVINEALEVIDGALSAMMSRELVSADEVADLLLDVRTLLSAAGHDN